MLLFACNGSRLQGTGDDPPQASAQDAGQPDAGGSIGAAADAGTVSAASDAGAADAGTVSATPIADAGTVSALPPDPDGGPIALQVAPALPPGDLACNLWILEEPLPQTNTLASIWAASAGDVWAVGDGGAIVHWDGTSWSAAPSPTSASLFVVWGTDARHIWAGGLSGTLLFFNGTAWSEIASPARGLIFRLEGTSANDLWMAAGEPSGVVVHVFHWDGAAWTEPGTSADRPIAEAEFWEGSRVLWPEGNGRAWVGGCTADNEAQLYHWDGGRWTLSDPGVQGCVSSIAGASANDVWATVLSLTDCGKGECDQSFALLHFDGKSWSRADQAGPQDGSLKSPFPGEVWMSSSSASGDLYRLEGGAFTTLISLPSAIEGDWTGASTLDIFSAGDGGLLAHSIGSSMHVDSGLTGQLTVFLGDNGDRPWAFSPGGGPALRRNGGQWDVAPLGPAGSAASSASVVSAAGPSTDNFWFVTFQQLFHWDGQAATPITGPGNALFTDVWISPQGNVFVADELNGIYRGDASGLVQVSTQPAETIWGSSETDLWIAAPAGEETDMLSHFDGTTVTGVLTVPRPIPAGNPMIRGTAKDDVWALVEDQLFHFDGTSWTNSNVPERPFGITVAGRGEVWAWSLDTAWFFDGTSWSATDAPAGRIGISGGKVYSTGWNSSRVCRKP